MSSKRSENDSLVSPDGFYKWRLSALPIVSISSSILAIVLGYIIGIETGSVERFPYLPFISDLGDLRPESSVFSFFITLSCYFSWCIFIVRYFQVKEIYSQCLKTNLFSLYVGAVLIVGKIMVSAFQLTNIKSVHFIGAGLYFAGVTLYISCQVYITFNNETRWRTLLLVVRIVCLIVMVINSIIFTVFMAPGMEKYNRGGANVAQTAEWLMAIFKMVFVFSFLGDFWGTKVSFHVHFHETQATSTSIRYKSLNG